MFDTFKMMSTINVDQFRGMTAQEVVKIYQETNDPKLKNKCFAFVFCDLFPMFIKIFKKYNIINPIDKTEDMIYYILRSMNRYKFSNEKSVKFTSYVYGNVARGLMTLTDTSLNNNKKKIWHHLYDCDVKQISHILNSVTDRDKAHELYSFQNDLENSSILNKQEIEYCKYVLQGHKHAEEICKLMGIKESYKIDKATKKTISCPIETSKEMKSYISKLRKNIKKKVTDNNFSFI